MRPDALDSNGEGLNTSRNRSKAGVILSYGTVLGIHAHAGFWCTEWNAVAEWTCLARFAIYLQFLYYLKLLLSQVSFATYSFENQLSELLFAKDVQMYLLKPCNSLQSSERNVR